MDTRHVQDVAPWTTRGTPDPHRWGFHKGLNPDTAAHPITFQVPGTAPLDDYGRDVTERGDATNEGKRSPLAGFTMRDQSIRLVGVAAGNLTLSKTPPIN